MEKRIKEKVEKYGKPLKEWDIQINYGIKTGFNDAFIIDGKTKDELVRKSPKSAEIIHPILRGRDIDAYNIKFADLWLINTHNGIKEKQIPRVNVQKDYPDVFEHLLKYKSQLMARLDKGADWSNLRNCAYVQEFLKPKIIYPNMTKFLPFAYDNTGFYTNQKCYIITGMKLGYLTAFLNSSLFKFCFRENFPELLGGTRELSKVFFEKISVKPVSNELEHIFLQKINVIQELKKQNKETIEHEQEVERILHSIYELDEMESTIINNVVL